MLLIAVKQAIDLAIVPTRVTLTSVLGAKLMLADRPPEATLFLICNVFPNTKLLSEILMTYSAGATSVNERPVTASVALVLVIVMVYMTGPPAKSSFDDALDTV